MSVDWLRPKITIVQPDQSSSNTGLCLPVLQPLKPAGEQVLPIKWIKIL